MVFFKLVLVDFAELLELGNLCFQSIWEVVVIVSSIFSSPMSLSSSSEAPVVTILNLSIPSI